MFAPQPIRRLTRSLAQRQPEIALRDGARVAVMGGGPAGSFFSYFLLDLAGRVGLQVEVDIYEPRDFARPGPAGCNMCGGILYEGFVQKLAAEGIALPARVVQRGIGTCTLHMDVGQRGFEAPAHERRIAAVHRGGGPLGAASHAWQSFDSYLLERALAQGATLLPARVEAVERVDGRLRVRSRRFGARSYELLAVAAGVNTSALQLFGQAVPGYKPPATLQIRAAEYHLGAEAIERYLGDSFHVFLLDLPGLDFAALIPKGECVTVALLGQAITPAVFETFLNTPQVRASLPPSWQPEQAVCKCSPRINVGPAVQPFGERIVFLGDSGVSRLYKDGLGAAYRAAKAAATAAVLHGIGAEDLRRHFWPVYRQMRFDNHIGKLIYWVIRQFQHRRCARQAMLAMVAREPPCAHDPYTLSAVLWDTFSGSVSYREILLRSLHPVFLGRLGLSLAAPLFARDSVASSAAEPLSAVPQPEA